MTRKTWPADKPLPDFASNAEEAQFWEEHKVAWGTGGEVVPRGGVVCGRTKVPALNASQVEALAEYARKRRMTTRQALKKILDRAFGKRSSSTNP